jgi:diadenylate cyclase
MSRAGWGLCETRNGKISQRDLTKPMAMEYPCQGNISGSFAKSWAMEATLLGFVLQIVYLFSHMTLINVVDIFLVAIFFFVVFQALHQTRTLQLLRGSIIIAILGAALLVLLPLDTFSWLVRALLLAGVVALPLLFQDELRRMLTGLGQFGRRRAYGTNFERFKENILNTVRRLAARNTGALVVLEGQTPLDDVISTGIPLLTEVVTPELLLTIFHPNTPLHDGAVVLRGDHVVAASCILPVQLESTGATHLGTRHRAALGLSAKVPDALVIVVSEETGRISVALAGSIFRGISVDELGEWLDRFRDQLTGDEHIRWRWLRGGGLKSSLQNAFLAVFLALIAWVSIIYQTNPPDQLTLNDIPLVVSGPGAGLILTSPIPATVKVRIQSTQSRIASMDAASVRAELSLDNLDAGVHMVPVQVSLADALSQVLSVQPNLVNVTVEPELSVTLTPTVKIVNLDTLPPGYAVGTIQLMPQTVTVKGAKSQVEMVTEVRIEVPIDDHRADFQQTQSPQLLDSAGEPLNNLTLSPKDVLVTVPIQQTSFTREVGVQADLDMNSLEDGYEISGIEVAPNAVILSGPKTALDSAGEFLVTAPISLTGVISDFSVDAPLIIPAGSSALNQEGDSIKGVKVNIQIAPVTDYYVLSVRTDLRNLPDTLNGQSEPSRVSVLLVGPRPLITQVKDNPGLVVIYLDLQGYEAGAYELSPKFEAPAGIQVQLFPSEVLVTLVKKAGG